MKATKRSKRSRILFILASILAVAVGWSNHKVKGTQRTPQPGPWIHSSTEPRQGFAFKVIKRANASDEEPTSVTDLLFNSGCAGAYNNKSASPPLHIHLYEDEHFEVLSGTMGFVLEGREGILTEGQTTYIPAGKPHTFWNAGPEGQIFRGRVTLINKSGEWSPNERFFDQKASIAYEYNGIENVNMLQILVTLKYGGIEVAAPYPLQLFIWYVVCPFAELLGYRGAYPEYIYP